MGIRVCQYTKCIFTGHSLCITDGLKTHQYDKV